MKILSMMLCFCFTLNVFAASNLEEVFNDYQYSMTVEWDQKDQDFKNTQTELFYKKIDSLVASGLTSKELMNFVESKVANKAALSAVLAEASAAQSTQEMMTIVNNHSENLYAKGANWNGETVKNVAIISVVSALFLYSIYFTIKYTCIEYVDGQKFKCDGTQL